MNNLEWLLQGDPVIVHLVNKYLLDLPSTTHNQGYIKKYLELVDTKTMKWGNGFYGPKWISTHYTLMELKDMEIDPTTPIYHQSLSNYTNYYWNERIQIRGIQSMDLCITGMMVSLHAYGKTNDTRLYQMIDYILDTPMVDGGWNCLWNHASKPKISSVHTTINVLEGLAEFVKQGYSYRIDEVIRAMSKGIKTLLNRQLYRIKNKTTPIHSSMIEHHYPPRWKYDYLRVLEFLAKQQHPYSAEIKPALDLLESKLKRGKLTKGQTISGLIHFPIEMDAFGRFNTLRAYKVLKFYNPSLYLQCIYQDF